MNDTEILLVAKAIRNRRKMVRIKKTQLMTAERALADAESKLLEDD